MKNLQQIKRSFYPVWQKSKGYFRKQKVSAWAMMIFVLAQSLVSLLAFSPVKVSAVSKPAPRANWGVNYPQDVTVEYHNHELWRFYGTWADGTPYDRYDAPIYIYATGDSPANSAAAFCIEPMMPIDNYVTSGYVKNPLPALLQGNRRNGLMTALWVDIAPKRDTDPVGHEKYKMVVQSEVWKAAKGLSIEKFERVDGSIKVSNAEYKAILKVIDDAITNYDKKPSFNEQTITLKVGESITLTDTNGVLGGYDTVRDNGANVDYSKSGNTLTITAKKSSNENGQLRFYKSRMSGTPVTYQKATQQTVMAGAINDPAIFAVNLKIQKSGDLKIKKVDEESRTAVPNTKFKVEGNLLDGSQSKEVTTGSNGEVTLNDIAIDGEELTITELSVPAPYVLDSTPHKVKIKAGETVSITAENNRQKGRIRVDKELLQNLVTNGGGKTLPNSNYSFKGIKFDLSDKNKSNQAKFKRSAALHHE